MTSIPQKSDVTQSDGILGRNLCHNRPDESLDSEKVHSRNVIIDTMYHTKCTLSFFFYYLDSDYEEQKEVLESEVTLLVFLTHRF